MSLPVRTGIQQLQIFWSNESETEVPYAGNDYLNNRIRCVNTIFVEKIIISLNHERNLYMKYLITAILLVTFVGCNSQKGGSGDTVSKLSSKKDSISYAIGVNLGSNLKEQSIEADPAVLAQGLKDSYSGGKLILTKDQALSVITLFQHEMAAKKEIEAKSAGEKFLAENKNKPGVVALPDGLQYKVIKMGTGKKPTKESTVTVNYTGKLVDGTEFDSSVKRGQPATFQVGGVIPGWTEILQMMPVGSKWEVYIPSALAYGERGTPGGPIPPSATLIFEVELVSMK
jgi:FKBP-type peptidyl-prolyl cis-trans isomerase FklB